jgi:hypothetical protein
LQCSQALINILKSIDADIAALTGRQDPFFHPAAMERSVDGAVAGF